MAFSVAATVLKNWPLLVKYGSTKASVYRKMGASTYSTTTKLVTKTITSSTNLDVLFDETTKAHKQPARAPDEPVIASDKVAFFPALSLSFVPSVDDVIVDNNSILWIVLAVAVDPAVALYTLTLRQIP